MHIAGSVNMFLQDELLSLVFLPLPVTDNVVKVTIKLATIITINVKKTAV